MNIKKDIETTITGWFFIASALLLLVGWVLLPHKLGEYIIASDFAKVGEQVWFWIWMFRIYIFGWVALIIAAFAFITISSRKPFRILLFPGAGMLIIGTFTLAIAAAFYYNYGAWGVGQTIGKSAEEIQVFMNDILYTNQYVTCFVRFGRIFSGVGLVLVGVGLIKWKLINIPTAWFTLILGLLAMCLILFIPDYYEYYKPVFYAKVLWIFAMGFSILKWGLDMSAAESTQIK